MAVQAGPCRLLRLQNELGKGRHDKSGYSSKSTVTLNSPIKIRKEVDFRRNDSESQIGKFKIDVNRIYPEAEFLDVIGKKVLRVFLLAIRSHLPPSPEQKFFETRL